MPYVRTALHGAVGTALNGEHLLQNDLIALLERWSRTRCSGVKKKAAALSSTIMTCVDDLRELSTINMGRSFSVQALRDVEEINLPFWGL